MQVHPVEVWDLLKVLGVGGKWGALQENFLRFFTELRNPIGDRDWPFILSMMRDHLDAGNTIDPAFAEAARRDLGPVDWEIVKDLPYSGKPGTVITQLRQKQQAYLHEFAHRCTPLRRFLHRNTRGLLRKYREKGLLKENVPHRKPKTVVELKGPSSERELYDRLNTSAISIEIQAERKVWGS